MDNIIYDIVCRRLLLLTLIYTRCQQSLTEGLELRSQIDNQLVLLASYLLGCDVLLNKHTQVAAAAGRKKQIKVAAGPADRVVLLQVSKVGCQLALRRFTTQAKVVVTCGGGPAFFFSSSP